MSGYEWLQVTTNDTSDYKPEYKGLRVNTSKDVVELSSLTFLLQVIKGNYELEHGQNTSDYEPNYNSVYCGRGNFQRIMISWGPRRSKSAVVLGVPGVHGIPGDPGVPGAPEFPRVLRILWVPRVPEFQDWVPLFYHTLLYICHFSFLVLVPYRNYAALIFMSLLL